MMITLHVPVKNVSDNVFGVQLKTGEKEDIAFMLKFYSLF